MPREAVGRLCAKWRSQTRFNVTIPYKETVDALPGRAFPRIARGRIGSVNTVVRGIGRFAPPDTIRIMFGFSVDIPAQRRVSHLKGKKALVLGSGGASKTVRTVLNDAGGCNPVVTISRKGPDNYQNLSRHSDAAPDCQHHPRGHVSRTVEASPIDLAAVSRMSIARSISSTTPPGRSSFCRPGDTGHSLHEDGLIHARRPGPASASGLLTGKSHRPTGTFGTVDRAPIESYPAEPLRRPNRHARLRQNQRGPGAGGNHRPPADRHGRAPDPAGNRHAHSRIFRALRRTGLPENRKPDARRKPPKKAGR